MSKHEAHFRAGGSRHGTPSAGASARRGIAQAPISRRRFLYGAASVGAVAAVGAGAAVLGRPADEGTVTTADGEEVAYLDVPESALSTLPDFEVVDEPERAVQLSNVFELPYGSLLWVTDDSVAACLLPTETGSPLSQVGLLALGSGSLGVVLEKAVGAAERFEIYDVRATSEGLIWTEANALEGRWRVYAAKLSGGSPGQPMLLEEGDATFDLPTLAADGKRAFWQVLPKPPNPDEAASRLMGVTFGKKDAACVFESKRRMATPPYSATGSVAISPRIDNPTVYYQLTNIESATGAVTDTLTLPHAMVPLETGYGRNGFMFSFPDIYDYGGGIANLGTYTPLSAPEGGDYSKTEWFGFARTPTAAPAWCKDLLIVKSSYSVCGVDLAKRSYFALDVDDGADTYGDYLASSGTHDSFVTYSNIDHTTVDGQSTYACRVKVWSPVS